MADQRPDDQERQEHEHQEADEVEQIELTPEEKAAKFRRLRAVFERYQGPGGP